MVYKEPSIEGLVLTPRPLGSELSMGRCSLSSGQPRSMDHEANGLGRLRQWSLSGCHHPHKKTSVKWSRSTFHDFEAIITTTRNFNFHWSSSSMTISTTFALPNKGRTVKWPTSSRMGWLSLGHEGSMGLRTLSRQENLWILVLPGQKAKSRVNDNRLHPCLV